MHPSLFLAARDGNVKSLFQLLHEDPLLLERTTFTTTTDNSLHIAAMLGHLNFVIELLKHKRDPKRFVEELNQHGFGAIHLASANGHVDVVHELLSINNNLKGKDGMTALHYATIKGRVEVINVLLDTSNLLTTLSDVTFRRETVLHLAMKNCQIEAFRVLLKMVIDNNMVDIINSKDDQGNTPLHLAAARRNREAIELLLDCNKSGKVLMQTNIRNEKGLTPLDLVVLFPCDSMDTDVERLLMKHGAADAQTSHDHHNPTPNPPAAPINEPTGYDLGRIGEYFEFDSSKTDPDKVRQNLLVVTGLFANATYQAAISPPGFTNHFATFYFLLFNLIGFHVSFYIILLVLTPSYPLYWEMYAASIAMVSTYGVAMGTITTSSRWVMVTIVALSFTLPLLIPYFFDEIRKWRKMRSDALASERHDNA